MTPSADPPDLRLPSPSRRRFLHHLGSGLAGAGLGAAAALVATRDPSAHTPLLVPPGSDGPTPTTAPLPPVADTFVITDHGATPDNADDGLARAIAAAADQGGGVVHVPAGEWTITRAVEVPSNVTLRGVTMLASTLRLSGVDDVVRTHPAVEGATVENLTLDGGIDAIGIESGGHGLSVPDGAAFCVVRRVLVRRVARSAISLEGAPTSWIYLQDLVLDAIGAHGIRIEPGEARGLFASGLAVGSFGVAAPGAAAVRTARRIHLDQVHVDRVGEERVGVAFLPGSDGSTLANFYLRLDGGTALAGEERAHVGAGSTQ